MSLLLTLSLFFISFTPLWISVLFVDVKSIFIDGEPHVVTEKVSIIMISIVAILSLIVLFFSLRKKNRDGAQKYTIVAACEEKNIAAEFVLSYVIPLLAFDFRKWDQAVLFVIFYSALFALYYMHNHFSINLVLELARYRSYKCKLINEDDIVIVKSVLSKQELNKESGKTIRLKGINNDCSLDLTLWKENKA